jgi:hypothetical protein
MTQFGRALAELNIEIICANSSHAKGRVERVNRTLQDRLVKELRLDGVCDMGTGNAFLSEFLERFNEKFSVRAAKPDNLPRRLTVSPDQLSNILCHREQRYVGQQLTPGVRSQADHPGAQCCVRGTGRQVCRPL